MTWVDLTVLGVLAVSALLAFMRGFVREVLGIAAWVGAVIVAFWAGPYAVPQAQQYVAEEQLATVVAYGGVFVVALLLLLLVSHWIGVVVRDSPLSGLDRTLGLLFGIGRGAVVVVFAYIAASMVVPIDKWPAPVLQARLLPYAYAGASWAVDRLPDGFRPLHPPAPPPERQTADADWLHATPQGRANDKTIARP
jgi:membrane protein required for colicin V production